MIVRAEWLEPTRAVGYATRLIAAVACGAAWAAHRHDPRRTRLPKALLILQIFLFADTAFDWRWTLHNWFEDQAIARNLYQQRTVPQEIALAVVGACALLAVALTARLLRGKGGAMLAAFGGLTSIAVWWVEVVSLHKVDMVFYGEIGPLMLVAYLWIVASAMTVTGILWDARTPTRTQ